MSQRHAHAPSVQPARPGLRVVVTAILVATFALDILSPLGVAAGVLYAGAILAISYERDTRSIGTLASACSVLVLLGMVFSSSVVSPAWVVVTNRVLSLVVVWTAAIVLVHAEHLRIRGEAAGDRVRVLEGLLPICMTCKKIRDEHDDWHMLESYISQHSEVNFSHGYCAECAVAARRELLASARRSAGAG